MDKITGKGIKVLKTAHLLFAFMLAGGVLSIVTLLFAHYPYHNNELSSLFLTLKTIDDWLTIPGATGILITGVAYGILTNWGFFKFKWIAVKWVLTFIMVLIGTSLAIPWGNIFNGHTIETANYQQNVSQGRLLFTLTAGCIQVILIVVILIISVLKPWTRKKNPPAVKIQGQD